MKQKKYQEFLKRNLPESEEVECKNCGQKFYDEWNLLSLESLKMCMLCANKYVNKQTIKMKYNVE